MIRLILVLVSFGISVICQNWNPSQICTPHPKDGRGIIEGGATLECYAQS